MTGKTALTITAEPEVAALLNDLQAIPPWERIYAGGRLALELRSAMAACTELRRAAILELRAEGATWAEIADVSGLTKSYVVSLARSGAESQAAADPESP